MLTNAGGQHLAPMGPEVGVWDSRPGKEMPPVSQEETWWWMAWARLRAADAPAALERNTKENRSGDTLAIVNYDMAT